jgi:hypothetical protein
MQLKENVRIADKNVKQKFVVVGFQDSYGKAQGWITNENANKLLHYDITQAYDYENLFLPQTAICIHSYWMNTSL